MGFGILVECMLGKELKVTSYTAVKKRLMKRMHSSTLGRKGVTVANML